MKEITLIKEQLSAIEKLLEEMRIQEYRFSIAVGLGEVEKRLHGALEHLNLLLPIYEHYEK